MLGIKNIGRNIGTALIPNINYPSLFTAPKNYVNIEIGTGLIDACHSGLVNAPN
jgi:hypothetical protein